MILSTISFFLFSKACDEVLVFFVIALPLAPRLESMDLEVRFAFEPLLSTETSSLRGDLVPDAGSAAEFFELLLGPDFPLVGTECLVFPFKSTLGVLVPAEWHEDLDLPLVCRAGSQRGVPQRIQMECLVLPCPWLWSSASCLDLGIAQSTFDRSYR